MYRFEHTLSVLRKQYPILPLKLFTKRDPFKTLITTILSQRSKDTTTLRIADNLFQMVGDTPHDIVMVPLIKLQKIIFASGFYRQKAKNIHDASYMILKRYNGKTPHTIEDLLSLPGVGRKTANIVLSHCFNKPAIAVDTHVHRICNRLGWIQTKRPEESEIALMHTLPRRLWSSLNDLLVRHGQEICKPRIPLCDHCVIKNNCLFYKKKILKTK